ncbi:Fe-S cluster assembly protein HesB [Glutamicibacter protophormiae]|uniref:Fe-S cluster assembly iron-binding protein IscA n=1 Tax=Glutamicibacter protophormiae TaxID=37930 RepID=A0ABS4XUP2_GLUPR|nr:Fe-S cluster assembly protein HesB [Glutamicibacter protophormiae]MBP2400239.1 Fe-S cluster assembly iron-binding protein IscA [Glutamicibacter protophormiae]QRQ77544.1 Fe-S cluster assembly protein HesB [Glutamicibacter protophormiae]WPR63532.1 Fe-S cluster assembly protein HesB [Glutamicibacter protophormiae]WPR67027.1 Fe-S cluster assembly protein HesB [Glutamicibacter protophormiae]GGL74138.1 iron-sulfur cluster biosynthesis protein [Glutamicibacter protophormiae]
MLTLTDQADAIVTSLVTNQTEENEAGLRIQPADAAEGQPTARFAVRVVDGPQPADQVIQGEGSPVFLDELVTDALDDKVLDANVDAEGTITFQVLAQR